MHRQGAPAIDIDAAGLRGILSRPLEPLPFGFAKPPEQELIDAARAAAAPAEASASLAKAASTLLGECEAETADRGNHRASVTLLARLGYLCAALRLDIDGTPFSRIGRRLLAESRDPNQAQDLFQVLRTAGRYETRGMPPEGERIPWDALLDDPSRGLRTLAAQVIVRLDAPSAMSRLKTLFEADVNDGLLAHELLTVMGESRLIEAATAGGPDMASRLAAGLRDAGHDDVAWAIERRRQAGARP